MLNWGCVPTSASPSRHCLGPAGGSARSVLPSPSSRSRGQSSDRSGALAPANRCWRELTDTFRHFRLRVGRIVPNLGTAQPSTRGKPGRKLGHKGGRNASKPVQRRKLPANCLLPARSLRQSPNVQPSVCASDGVSAAGCHKASSSAARRSQVAPINASVIWSS